MKKIVLVITSILAAVSLTGCAKQENKKIDVSSKYAKDTNVAKFENYEKQTSLDKQELRDVKKEDYSAQEGWGREEYEFYYYTDLQKITEARKELSKKGKLIVGKDYIIVIYKTAKEETIKILKEYR